MEIIIRPARIREVEGIKRLINKFAREKRLLRRSEKEIRREIRDFFVAVTENGEIVGCVALDVYSRKLAEVRSLAVDTHWGGLNLGSELVQACLARAKSRKVAEVMAITSSEKFFEKQGFGFALPHEKKALFYWTK